MIAPPPSSSTTAVSFIRLSPLQRSSMPTTSTPIINTRSTAKSTKRQATPAVGHHKKKKAKNRIQNKAALEKECCPASEALLKIERLGCDELRVILAEGWDHVLPQKGEDDPGSLIMWDDDNVEATVAAFNAAINLGAVPPYWMNVAAGVPITTPALKTAILAHVQASSGGGGVVGNAMIAPNTVPQYKNMASQFCFIGIEPFFRKHAVCPIGRNYILADRTHNTTAVADPIAIPPVALGVGVFN